MNIKHKYTDEQREFIKNNVKGNYVQELTELFNKEFNLDLKRNQIKAYMKNHNLKNGLYDTFQKGHIPANKGKKVGSKGRTKETQFKKGSRPHNYIPLGGEKVIDSGYIMVKIAEPKTWKFKHILEWEKANGPVPKGYVVIFADTNKRNFDIDNLILVSRSELLVMNNKGLIKKDKDLTKAGVMVAKLTSKINKLK